MYYLYIIYSPGADLFYVGVSQDPQRRLIEHNSNPHTTFTSRHRPWVLKAIFQAGPTLGDAMKLERFIKKQKNRKIIESLCDESFVPTGILAQMVRVPHVRD